MATTAPELATVEGAMSAEFPFCFPNTSLAQAARMMAQNRLHELPVIVDQRCLGYVSYLDILQRYVKARLDGRAADIIRTPLPEVRPRTPVAEAARVMRETGRQLLLVREGQVVGVFGHRESVAAYGDGAQPGERFMRSPLPERSVDDSMEAGAEIMFREDTPYLMLTQDERRLFRKTARPVGMVTAFEILEEIGRTTTDTAANKQFLGRRDLG